LDLDDAMKPSEFLNILLDPADERPTGGGKAHIEPGIHIALILGYVMPIDIHQDGAVSVDTTSKEVGEVLVRNGQWPKRQALRRREINREE